MPRGIVDGGGDLLQRGLRAVHQVFQQNSHFRAAGWLRHGLRFGTVGAQQMKQVKDQAARCGFQPADAEDGAVQLFFLQDPELVGQGSGSLHGVHGCVAEHGGKSGIEFTGGFRGSQGQGKHMGRKAVGFLVDGAMDHIGWDQEHFSLPQKDLPVGEMIQVLPPGGIVQLVVKMAVHDRPGIRQRYLMFLSKINEIDGDAGVTVFHGNGTDAVHNIPPFMYSIAAGPADRKVEKDNFSPFCQP